MPPPLAQNQLLFDAKHFAGGTIKGNPGEPTRTLTPEDNVFPEGSVVVVSFKPDGSTITRLDVFESQAAFDKATSLDDSSAAFYDRKADPEDAANGLTKGLQEQAGQEGDTFEAYNQPNDFFKDGIEDPDGRLFDDVKGVNLLFAPNVDLSKGKPVVIGTDLDHDEDETFDPFDIICFGAGTLIATPGGELAVETLRAGDLITTIDGKAVPVKWIGWQTVKKHGAQNDWVAPVKVRQGALDEHTPHTDLVLTPDHGLLIEGAIVNAGALVNGTSVVRLPLAEVPDVAVYYHVETENHDVILANGTAAETFVDNTTRAAFDNYGEYEALFGTQSTDTAELSLARAMSARQLPARVRERLARRASVISPLRQVA
ncbi:MAG: Hint domain-containing protein [Pseudomonadota bacterium]